MFLRRWVVGFWLLALGGGAAFAHPANEANIYHNLYLKAEPGRLTLESAAVVGGLLTQTVWPQWDTDGDHRLSPEEREHAAGELEKEITLTVEGRKVPLKLENSEFAEFEGFFSGSAPASVHLRLTATLPKIPVSGLLVSVRDDTWPHFRGVFADPDCVPAGVSIGPPHVSEDGRVTEVVLQPEGAAASGNTPAGTHDTAGSLPGLTLFNGPLTVPSQGGATSAGANSPAVNAPLRDLDLRNAPLFPDHGKFMMTVPKAPPSETEGLKGLLGKRLSLGLILFGLGAALLAGMAHALTPGHGKTLVGAYLVGSHGTVGDAVLLGLVVTVTHTLGVYILGFLCLWLTTRIQATTVGLWLEVVSGMLVAGMGFWLFQRGLLAYYGLRELPGHTHGPGGHSHGHTHTHDHAHTHADEAPAEAATAERRPPNDSPLEDYRRAKAGTAQPRQTKWDLVGLGVAGGIVPCFDALAILVLAVNLGNILFGLALIAAFSVGLALVLVLIGILMVKAKDLMARFTEEAGWVKFMPVISGGALLILGLWLTLQALTHTGLRIG